MALTRHILAAAWTIAGPPLRGLDMLLLWPQCKALSNGNLDLARAAFAVHAFVTPCWAMLGEHELIRRIDELE